MAPGILFIPFVGFIIPVRLSIALALLVIYIKISLVSPQSDSTFTTGRFLLLATAIANLMLGGISIGLICLRDESKLEPLDRWYSAVVGLVTRVLLLGPAVASVWGVVKEYEVQGIQKKEEVLALVGLSILLLDLIVGIILHLRGMRIAHIDGQQQVQKELLRRRYAESLALTQAQTTTNSSANSTLTYLPTPPAQYRHRNHRESEHGGLDVLEMTSTNHSVATIEDRSVKYPFAGYQSGGIGKKSSFSATESEMSFRTSRSGPNWNKGGMDHDLERHPADHQGA